MNITPPAGWTVERQSDHAARYVHAEHALEVSVSPVYKSRNQSGRHPGETPHSYRVQRQQDWFSEGVLGDCEASAKVESREEAIATATAYMEEFASADTTGNDTEQSQSPPSAVGADPVSTGSSGLDAVLNGGFPAGRTILVTGTPGAGKSTLAMQFLQAGLESGDRCLYVSTEQTRDEIRSAFESFDFDLTHDNLAISTIHAVTNDDGDGLRVAALGGDDGRDPGDTFSRQGVINFLRKGVSADRVVLDSVSGLRPMSETADEYRRAVLDIIRLFSDEFGATALLTSEYFRAAAGSTSGVEHIARDNAVQYNTHGVVRLWRERVNGEYRRFLDVMKMRGVNHDNRAFEARIDADGLAVVSGPRSFGGGKVEWSRLSTGIDALDERLGGGLVHGSGTLIEHDEQSSVLPLVLGLGNSILDEMMSIVLVPGTDLKPQRVEALFDELGTDVRSLLERDQLFIVDTYGVWSRFDTETENVVVLREMETELEEAFHDITERARGRATCYIVDVPALVSVLGADEAQQFRYWLEANEIGDDDVLIDISNPELVASTTETFYADIAQQVVSLWVTETGIQYLKTRKGPGAQQGAVDAIEFVDDPPYISLF